MTSFLSFFLHLDQALGQWIQLFGVWAYVFLFLIIFCETGLVFAPFLPGDSLLFAAGAFAGIGQLNPWMLWIALLVAALAGDTVNYWIGRVFGDRILRHPRCARLIHPRHVAYTEKFYAKHGSRMIFFARFVPIVRTIAPFVAGLGRMQYRTFLAYNIFGGFVWITLFLFAGYFFGNIPFVKENFSPIIFLIVLLSFIPPVLEWRRHRAEEASKKAESELL